MRDLVVAAAVVGGFSSCGGGGSNRPTPVSTPTPAPLPTVVRQGNLILDGPDEDGVTFYDHARIDTTATGRLETTVDWTYATNSVWMYIAEGDCTGEKFTNPDCPGGPTCECRFSVVSERDLPKPRVLTVPNASAGLRTLIVWNLGPQAEAVSYQALLTPGAVGSTTVTVHSAASASGTGGPPRRRMASR